MIIVDNVVRDGDVINGDTEDAGTQGVRRFFDRVSTSALVTSTAIQTVGLKGYDGFTISIVN
jgi:predicted O-methyltransferase YrrM